MRATYILLLIALPCAAELGAPCSNDWIIPSFAGLPRPISFEDLPASLFAYARRTDRPNDVETVRGIVARLPKQNEIYVVRVGPGFGRSGTDRIFIGHIDPHVAGQLVVTGDGKTTLVDMHQVKDVLPLSAVSPDSGVVDPARVVAAGKSLPEARLAPLMPALDAMAALTKLPVAEPYYFAVKARTGGLKTILGIPERQANGELSLRTPDGELEWIPIRTIRAYAPARAVVR